MLAVTFFLVPYTFPGWRAHWLIFLTALELETGCKLATAGCHWVTEEFYLDVRIICQHFTMRFLASNTKAGLPFFLKSGRSGHAGSTFSHVRGLSLKESWGLWSHRWGPSLGPGGNGSHRPRGTSFGPTQWILLLLITAFVLLLPKRMWSLFVNKSLLWPLGWLFLHCSPGGSEAPLLPK